MEVYNPYTMFCILGFSAYALLAGLARAGDPTYVPGLPLDRGGAEHNGKVPRDSEGVQFLMKNYRHAIKFYCSPRDSACDSGTAPNANQIHQVEVATWSPHAKAFILRHV